LEYRLSLHFRNTFLGGGRGGNQKLGYRPLLEYVFN